MRHIATFDLRLRPFTEYEGAPDLQLSKPDAPPVFAMPPIPVFSDEVTAAPTLEQLRQLDEFLLQHPNRVHLEAEHHFAPHQYLRLLQIPAGACLTGMMHAHEHLSILASGTIRVTTDDGMKTISGPMIVHAKAMTKRAAVALTDAVWINVVPTDLTDPDEIQRAIIAPQQGLLA